MRRFALTWTLIAAACGVQEFELAPSSGELLVLDAIAAEDLARLQADTKPDMKPEPKPAFELSYPADGTALPANIAPVTFLFGTEKMPMEMMPMEMMKPPGMTARAFELRFASQTVELSVYTARPEATLPLARWRTLLQQHDGDELKVSVRALLDDRRVVSSKTVRLRILAATESARVSYWSETRAAPVAVDLETGEPRAARSGYPSLIPWQSFSREGGYSASLQDRQLSLSRAGQPLPSDWATSWQVSYPSWSSDGSLLLFVSLGAASDAPPAMMPPMMAMPSPMEMARSALVSVRLADEPPTATTIFSVDKPDESLAAPSFSPDGTAIAFERRKGADELGTLWLVRSDGGETRALDTKLAGDGRGSLPTWLGSLEEDLFWLAFSANRAPEGSLPRDVLQLWCIALQRDAKGTLQRAGEPFWLPFQAAQEDGRRLLVE